MSGSDQIWFRICNPELLDIFQRDFCTLRNLAENSLLESCLCGQVDGVGSEVGLQLGNRFEYQLDVDLPAVSEEGSSLQLAISTMDPDYSKQQQSYI